jgi:drug/metabolite transporter (DMT)-like permease
MAEPIANATAVITVTQAARDPAYLRSVYLVLTAAALWSFSGLVFRQIENAEPFQVIFYRSLAVSFGCFLVLLLRYRRRTYRTCRAMGWPGLVAALCLGLASFCFLQAIFHTTIANVSFLVAAHPFFAAALAWLLLREQVALRTWLASALALSGVLLMVAEGLTFGGALGNFLALGAGLLSAGYAVALRYGRQHDMLPAVMLAGLVAMLAALPFVEGFSISWRDLGLCFLQGMVISAFCNGIFAYAARAVPAAELTLLSLLETVLAPTWVWLFIAEMPSALTLLGGGIILTAVLGLGHAALSRRKQLRSLPP